MAFKAAFDSWRLSFTENDLLEYDELDELMRDMLIELYYKTIQEVSDEDPAPVSQAVIDEWENVHRVTLPKDYKWFLLNVGAGFPGWIMGDLQTNKDESLCWFDLRLGSGHFHWVMGLGDIDYGRIYKVSDDITFNSVEELKSYIQNQLNNEEHYESFVDFYKHKLVEEHNKYFIW